MIQDDTLRYRIPMYSEYGFLSFRYITLGDNIPKTMCEQRRPEQCTGFRDSKDNLIYVNDIVSIKKVLSNGYIIEVKGRVIFEDGAFKVLDTCDQYHKLMNGMNVIGNVHEGNKMVDYILSLYGIKNREER